MLVKISLLALVAVSSAVEVKFMRWARGGCERDHHIRKDVHIKNNHCKTFDKDEPHFHSFMMNPKTDKADVINQYCQATIYHYPNCKGDGFTYGDMIEYTGRCGNTTLGGRSVRIACERRTNNVVTSKMKDYEINTSHYHYHTDYYTDYREDPWATTTTHTTTPVQSTTVFIPIVPAATTTMEKQTTLTKTVTPEVLATTVTSVTTPKAQSTTLTTVTTPSPRPVTTVTSVTTPKAQSTTVTSVMTPKAQSTTVTKLTTPSPKPTTVTTVTTPQAKTTTFTSSTTQISSR